MSKWIALIFAIGLSACSSVTMRTDQAEKTKTTPDFQKSYHYFWWGLDGEHAINVREVCGGKKVEQMQAVSTIPDVFFGTITLGIYSPRTARVWCEGGSNE